MARNAGLIMVKLLFWLGLIFVFIIAISVGTRVFHATAGRPFDHSQCQYPTRTTNPPNGCDNSDPCDPADAAKGGSGVCP